ncbi:MULTISPECIES: HD domain-containing protein [unclassified Leptolyngbya]|uniref:HD domain-containing protein n=1 Tax=unclassified Leptolyngbya TaxID=2650499 RepID=UPI001683A4FB|nr:MULTISPECIES: HD domain-containing protein [unclassified Leptolyngbya]MBD1911467.1 bifunctional (p)ppGpp synthetase/guanosine-3',5'-bis(diphosphate) 3'-pyrophosphohydrolase [Leptolyngbya sp. FACHB-8]MBD2156399.1 bifunctional (p)ppGpp synthetase/guanosine-3',5'-bis(diphosphate) 3'-pyrophosphohydrolase [Leptolyngbya sp. FACHB-16]
MQKLEQAIQLATRLHAGQVDKAGEDYIQHPLRVMNAVEGETTKIVAVLHDTLEDTPITFEELEGQFGSDVASAVQALTRLEGEDYFDFIERVKQNAIATTVKIADLKDNMNLSRMATITEKDLARHEKYKKALQLLH